MTENSDDFASEIEDSLHKDGVPYSGWDGDFPGLEPEPKSCWRKVFPYGFWQEFKELAKLAVPIMFTGLVNYLIAPVTLLFVGRLGSTELASLGLSRSIFHVAGLSILLGLLTACETLFSQTFGGKNHFRLGVQVQRAAVILICCCMPCWAIYIIIEPILLVSGQPPLVAKNVSNLMLAMIPALLKRAWPPLIAGICGNLVNALALYLLLFHTNIGIIGAAIAQSLAYFTQAAVVIGYIICSGLYKQSWDAVHVELWHDWGIWFRLGIPGMMMSGLEWWACESGSLLSGLRGEKVLAIQTILNNIESIIFCTFPLGLSVATSLRIGHFLGANKANGPRSTAAVALITNMATSTLTAVIILATRYQAPKVFSNDPEIIEGAAHGLLSILCYQFFGSLFGICAGILRGAGLQMKGAIVCCFSMYLVGAPLGLCLLLLTDLTVNGFWYGISSGAAISTSIFVVLIVRIDWVKMCEKAKQRTVIRFVSGNNDNDENISESGQAEDEDLNNSIAKNLPDQMEMSTPKIIGKGEDSESTYEDFEDGSFEVLPIRVTACAPRLIIHRSLLLGSFVGLLLLSIICRSTIRLADYFQNYCILANQTLVPIPDYLTPPADLSCIRYLP